MNDIRPMDPYRERAHLLAHFATVYPAVIAHTDPFEPTWPVLTVTTPAGQMAWHISPTDRDLFRHVPTVQAPPWDGHDTPEKYTRLSRLTEMRAHV